MNGRRVENRRADLQSATPASHLFPAVAQGLRITHRNLPHWQSGGATYFLTFRLRSGGVIDPMPLSREERQVVKQAILFWHSRKWIVHMLTVMPDHVHILATPQETSHDAWPALGEILKSVKRASAREINRRRRERGSLWQADTFDRIIRNEREFDNKSTYVLTNAVKAGLVEDGWEYDGLWCEGDNRGGGLQVRPTEGTVR